YKNELQKNAKTFYEKQAFLMFSMDISGIQDFIYTINSKGALKGLRSRSFYLEIMLENIIDEILEKLEYSRTNLIYSGGGHAYIIFANTKEIKNTIDIFIKGVNKWFLEYFNTSLYIAASYVECSANQLGMRSNKGNDEENHEEYKNIFKSLSNNISIKKSNRYSSGDILKLNESSHEDHSRECIICHRSDYLTAEDKCDICSNLEGMSQDIINKNSFFVVLSDDSMLEKGKARIILPVNRYLVACGENDGKKYIKNEKFVRIYSKNRWYEGLKYSTKLWVGDYVPEGKYTFEDLVKSSTGIERLCVLRADIDNLGQAFVSGFKNEHVSLSRVATFSRKLSIFFKKHINYLLENGEFFLDSVDRTEKDKKKRNIIIVYSGGDDVFLVGAWDDVIGASIDIRNAFKCFSQNTLTISAGIGIYPDKYPISAMARESGDLEDEAKKYKDKNGNEKNALTLFSEKFTFSWDEFIDKVINEKYKLIKEFFEKNNERGKNFLYNLLDYIRNTNEKINIARFAYLLSRMEPDEKKLKNQELLEEQKAIYNRFKKNMYSWIKEKDGASRKELEIAIYLYVYLTREKESDRDGK
ncbi:MAG: type III-A CRISPR-associated protein Cas10/Csm1, partial [Fusobacteriaceae bacterium]|nr:type III-A CRISPR-associated protein Cas10/Csm1 [Fusobacteriaceae bacterium]